MTEVCAGTRGPNYDWKHEAEHYRTECDKLRGMLQQIEGSSERRIYELEAALKDYKNGGGFWGRTCSRQGEKIKLLCAELKTARQALNHFRGCLEAHEYAIRSDHGNSNYEINLSTLLGAIKGIDDILAVIY